MCYAFNDVSAGETPLKTTSEGPDYGLTLIIDVEKSYYMRHGLSPREGISIALSEPSETPNLLTAPIEIGINDSSLLQSLQSMKIIFDLVEMIN